MSYDIGRHEEHSGPFCLLLEEFHADQHRRDDDEIVKANEEEE